MCLPGVDGSPRTRRCKNLLMTRYAPPARRCTSAMSARCRCARVYPPLHAWVVLVAFPLTLSSPAAVACAEVNLCATYTQLWDSRSARRRRCTNGLPFTFGTTVI